MCCVALSGLEQLHSCEYGVFDCEFDFDSHEGSRSYLCLCAFWHTRTSLLTDCASSQEAKAGRLRIALEHAKAQTLDMVKVSAERTSLAAELQEQSRIATVADASLKEHRIKLTTMELAMGEMKASCERKTAEVARILAAREATLDEMASVRAQLAVLQVMSEARKTHFKDEGRGRTKGNSRK